MVFPSFFSDLRNPEERDREYDEFSNSDLDETSF